MKNRYLNSALSLLVNKYTISLIVFSVWVVFFDQNNLIDRLKSRQRLSQLKSDTVFYQEKIRENREAIRLLKTNPQNLEKFAREKYRMKTPEEEVFVILKKGEIN
jgi:cell division protein DivIC